MNLDKIYDIALNEIAISENNVRLHDPDRDLVELAASIGKHGLLQPVVLLGEYGSPPYELISGQRRFLAHKKHLRATSIRAVFNDKLNRTQAIIRSLVENLQRVELEYVDTAKAITELYNKFGKDEEKVQRETGLSIRRIREYILIDAQATPKMKKLLTSGQVSASDVKRALRAAQDNIKKAEELLELIVEYKPTAHQKRRLVQYGEQDKRATAKHILQEALRPHVEQSIVISLSEAVREGLSKATEKMSMEPEELASQILNDWLQATGLREMTKRTDPKHKRRELEPDQALAVLIASTRSKRRSVSLPQLADSVRLAVKALGSYAAVADRIGISPKMLRQFSYVERLSRSVMRLFEDRRLDSVDAATHLAMLSSADQLVLARALASGSIDTSDLRAVVQWRKTRPAAPIQQLLDGVAASKTQRQYVIEFITRGARTRPQLIRIFRKYIPSNDVIDIQVDGALGRLILTRNGRDELFRLSKTWGVNAKHAIVEILTGSRTP